jgi:hypothetical protein
MEQWMIRGWPKGPEMFHKNNCQCCNNYVAHAIHACKEQGINLPIQAVGDAVTKAWPMLMRDLKDEAQDRALESYKDLADDTASLKAEVKASEAALDSEHSRLAYCIDAHPKADRFNDPPGNIADDVPEPDMSMPDGWESNPNWGSEASVWAQMRGPDDPPKPLSKKRRKQAHDYEQVDGWTAAREKATREYPAQSTTHTVVDDDALKSELRMARRSFTLQEAERARNVVIPTPQFADLMVRPRYPGEGEPLPARGSSHTCDGEFAPPTRPFGAMNSRLG